mgnify:CR=1 FL=1
MGERVRAKDDRVGHHNISEPWHREGAGVSGCVPPKPWNAGARWRMVAFLTIRMHSRRWIAITYLFLAAAALLTRPAPGGVELTPFGIPAAAPAVLGLDPRKPVYAVPVQQRLVGFAVNVDWGDEYIPGMLAVLAERGVHVTFFPTGRWATRRPDLVQAMAAAGHELGNHGDRHDHPKALGDNQLAELIRRGQERLEDIAGVRTSLFAPPYGEVDARIARVAAETGHWTIMWTVDTVDWRQPPPDVIVQRVLSRVQPGAIVLMHPTEPTLTALPIILDRLMADGWQVVPVGRLLAVAQQPAADAPGH